jgi:hypothetical protein
MKLCGNLSFLNAMTLSTVHRVVNLLPFAKLSHNCLPRLIDFLAHPFPKVWMFSFLTLLLHPDIKSRFELTLLSTFT